MLLLWEQTLFSSSQILAFENVGLVLPKILYFRRRQTLFFHVKSPDFKILTSNFKSSQFCESQTKQIF